MSDRENIIKEVLDNIEADLSDEEILHLLIKKKISQNTLKSDRYTLGQRAADKIANFVGSWAFIILFIVCLIVWMAANVIALTKAFDPYPFILLNLVLSCVAAIQAPLIMMSQNRQEEKDRERAENDYRINLKSEIIVEDLHKKIDRLIENQEKIIEKMNDK